MKLAEDHKQYNTLFYWFTQVREKESPISWSVLQEKAMYRDKAIGGYQIFSANLGWLDHWKKRHGVLQIGMCC